MRTKRRRNAPDGAETPEKVPNSVRKTFSRRLVAAELRAIAEALRQGAPAKWSPDRHVRFREDIIQRLERLAGEVRA